MSGNKRASESPLSASKRQKSSNSSSASCSNIHWKYDVFLSFSGDTRYNFTDHLYSALERKAIITFKDDVRLETGKEISSELLEAIEGSRFSIVILSKDYASSKWCLEELAKIVECVERKNHTLFPVFHKVDPSDVRNQKGDFKTAFDKHEQDFRDNLEKVERWRSALTKVGKRARKHLQDGSEAKLIESIIDEIQKRLNQIFSNDVGDLVGIDSSVQEILELLEPQSNDIRFIGIWGMAGIGKTTIARAVFDCLSNEYEVNCFLRNVREVFKEKGVVHLQEKLLSKVLNGTNINIGDDIEGRNYVRRLLCRKKVLVVLDDVDDQLEQLAMLADKPSWFGAGSRIIITTRDQRVLRSHGISSIYEVKGLEYRDAFQLFHMNAFRNEQPKDDLVELSKQVVSSAKGLPLALIVLGSHLCGRTVEDWNSVLKRLRQVHSEKILKKLRISYDVLEENEKKLFLDIACFFKGKQKDRVIEILDGCESCDSIGINTLVEKCLITISYNELDMHDLLQEMGWEIVRERHNDCGKWSRLWLFEDVNQVLTNNRGTEEVEGIMLKKPERRITLMDGKCFSSMINLRLLKISNVILSKDLEYLSDELRFLKWPGYPSDSLPSKFCPPKLFELNLSHSQIIYLWKGMKFFQKLKTIKLSFSKKLVETPNFISFPNLEKLDLEGCTSLRKLQESIGLLEKLIVLNLKGCRNLENLPSNICRLKLLMILNLHGCSKLHKLPQNLGELECLEKLDAGRTAIRQVPISIAQLTKLEYLSFCGSIVKSPQSWWSSVWSFFLPRRYRDSMFLFLPPLRGLCSLKILDVSDCNLLAFPNDLGSLRSLNQLNLSNNNFVSLPSMSQLRGLQVLYVENCRRLKSLPELPQNLIFLWADNCSSLEDTSSALSCCASGNMALNFFCCPKLLHNQGRDNNLAVMLLKEYLKQPVNRLSLFHIWLPGSEIPNWFNCRRDGNSAEIELPPNWLDDKFIGIAICGVFRPDPEHLNGVLRMKCAMSIMSNAYFFPFLVPDEFSKAESDHVWLLFVSGEAFKHLKSYLMGRYYPSVNASTCIHAVFSTAEIHNGKLVTSTTMVIKCGIRPVYKQDIESSQESLSDEGSISHQNHSCSTGYYHWEASKVACGCSYTPWMPFEMARSGAAHILPLLPISIDSIHSRQLNSSESDINERLHSIERKETRQGEYN